MLELGMAASYAPAMFRDAAEWPSLHGWLTNGAPRPLELAQETPAVLRQHKERIEAGFTTLREQVRRARLDAIVLLASDTGRVFSGVQVPQFSTYLGDEIWGSTRLAELGEPAAGDIVRLRCAPDLAAFVHRELVSRDFDMNYSKELRPLGQPEYGTAVAFVAPARALMPDLDIPVIPIYVNSQVPPAPSGRRCFALGRALAEILDERPERVAILASGGLSQDNHGPRAGWIDEPLDRWVLDHLSRGKATELQSMFDVDSDALRGGTAQIRLWLIVAGACEARHARAVTVDYIPAFTMAAGIAFAYWPVTNGAAGSTSDGAPRTALRS